MEPQLCPKCREGELEPYESPFNGRQMMCQLCGYTTEDKMQFETMKSSP